MSDKDENEWLRRALEEAQAQVYLERQEKEEAKAREAQERREKEEAKAREEEAKAREEEAKAREEEAKAREAQERREKERVQRENRQTTLHEYLRNCHSHLYNRLWLADPSISSTGFTKVSGKSYPKRLRPWSDFETVHLPQHFDFISKICGEKQHFQRPATTTDVGAQIARTAASNEKSVENFEKVAVENPVMDILAFLANDEEACVAYNLAGLHFSTNPRELTQASDEGLMAEDTISEGSPDRQRRAGPNKPLASEKTHKDLAIRPDGYGIRTKPDGSQAYIFVYDYKAAHKIPTEHIRPAVAKEHLFREVAALVNRGQYSSDTEARAQENAEACIAMALTQVFDYMMAYGVSYGYVAAGQSLLLLHVDRSDPEVLYCHPCLPIDDIGEPNGDWTDQLSQTAVAQLLCFCLLSCQSEAVGGRYLASQLSAAKTKLPKWPEPYDNASDPGLEPSESSSAASSQATDGSDFVSNVGPTGRDVGLRSRSSCKPPGALPPGDEDDEDEDGSQEAHSRDASRLNQTNKRKDGPPSGSDDEDAPTRQYCTQECLLGLKRGKDLDKNCPNVSMHRSDGSSRHAINADQFTDLVRQQLLLDPYRKCQLVDFLGKRGAIGWLFKLELVPYGYTFVAKGTLEGRLHRLEHEGEVYARLEHLQGEVVPVHLGLVRLDPGYILPGFRFVVHMMLMSWAGERPSASVDDTETLKRESMTAILSEGVDHGDDCSANYLCNAERRRIMIIDFDRARLFPRPKPQAVSRLSRLPKRERGSSPKAGAQKRRVLGTTEREPSRHPIRN